MRREHFNINIFDVVRLANLEHIFMGLDHLLELGGHVSHFFLFLLSPLGRDREAMVFFLLDLVFVDGLAAQRTGGSQALALGVVHPHVAAVGVEVVEGVAGKLADLTGRLELDLADGAFLSLLQAERLLYLFG